MTIPNCVKPKPMAIDILSRCVMIPLSLPPTGSGAGRLIIRLVVFLAARSQILGSVPPPTLANTLRTTGTVDTSAFSNQGTSL